MLCYMLIQPMVLETNVAAESQTLQRTSGRFFILCENIDLLVVPEKRPKDYHSQLD